MHDAGLRLHALAGLGLSLTLLGNSACTEPNPNADAGSGSAEEGETSSSSESSESSEGETGDAALCGDGEVEGDEECDEGEANDDNAACKSDCTDNVCGDGFVGPDEGCDAGTGNSDSGTCTKVCELNVCGDGLVGPDETCDEGSDNLDTGACTTSCEPARCGDAFTGPGEECDDGNADEDDGCRSNCRLLESPTCEANAQTPGEWCFEVANTTTELGDASAWAVFDVDQDDFDDLVFVDSSPHHARWMLGSTNTFSNGHDVNYDALSIQVDAGPICVGQFVPGGAPEVLMITHSEGDADFEVWQTASTGPNLVEAEPMMNPVVASNTMIFATTVQFDASSPPVAAAIDGGTTTLHVAGITGAPGSFTLEERGAVYGADFGTGIKDALVVRTLGTPQRLQVYRTNGPTMTKDQQIELGSTSEEILNVTALIDLDADGIDELVGLNAWTCAGPDTSACTENTLSIYAGANANEPLSLLSSIPVGFGVSAFAVGDFNVDGHLDIVVSRVASQDLLVLETDGSALEFPYRRSVAPGTSTTVTSNTKLIAGDFNGDATPDLLVHTPTSPTSGVLWSRP